MRFPRLAVVVALLGLGVPRATADDAELRRRLGGNDAADAFRATTEIAAKKDPLLAGMLVEAGVETAFPHVAVGCGDALEAIGTAAAKDDGYRRAVEKALKQKEPRILANLARILGAYGDASVDDALASLAASRRAEEVQVEALYMVGDLVPGPDAPFTKSVDAVRLALKSTEASAQCAAASAAGRLHADSMTEALVDLARKATDRRAGLYAIQALRRIGQPVDIGPFLHVVTSGAAKRETLNACLRGITDLSKPDDVEALLSLTRATSDEARDAACIALGRLCWFPRGAAAAPRAGESTYADPTAKPIVGDPAVRSKIVDRLLQIVEQDTSYAVRDAACRALVRFGPSAHPAIAEKVVTLVDAKDRDVALTAMDLAGVAAATATQRSLVKIATYDEDPVRRMFAARALETVAPAATVEEALAAVQKDKKGRDTTLSVLRMLGYLRTPEAFQGLVGLLGAADASEPFLREVERALERLTRHRFGRNPTVWDTWYAKRKDHDPFVFHVPLHDRARGREEVVAGKKFGLTESTERAVESGLRWLEQQQHVEGWWDGNEKGFNGFIGCEPAYTGLCLLAYLGAGYGAGHGKYRETIRRGTEYLAATQYHNGGFPVAGTGDQSAFFAYVIGMATWALNESYTTSGDPFLKAYAQRGLDYMVRTQTPGGGWRYGPRYLESDASCTSWVYMGLKAGLAGGLEVPQKSIDGIDFWLEKAQSDMTGETERPEDISADYEREVGVKRTIKAITGYLPIKAGQQGTYHQDSMTPVGMVCRVFMGWKRSHPFLIGSANYTSDTPPQWMKGPGIGEFYYYWYYGTLAMHQMGGRYWRAWNEKIKTMLPDRQRVDPPPFAGSWDPDTSRGGGGRLFSTPAAILTLETYYRFSPLLSDDDPDQGEKPGGGPGAGMAEPAMDGGAMDGAGMDDPGMAEPAMDGAGMDDPGMAEPAMDGAAMGG